MERTLPGSDIERLFIAVKLPARLCELLRNECAALYSELKFAKWTHFADYHITLQFLGDTPKPEIPALLEALRKVSAACAPFQLQLAQWGVFGLPEAPRVLWAGVSGELEKLNRLQRSVVSSTRPLGFTPEARAYNPHLTLARKYRDKRPFSMERLESLSSERMSKDAESGELDWTVDGFLVYATRMHAIPMYEMIEKFTFFR
ncbi:RNA 2',3'-cyclic phosphodiesterase [Paenibacillus sp. BAC0078]